MSVRDLFQGDFSFKSNDSLDTQITASIDRGDFHLAIFSLLSLIAWSIYMLFYNSRIIGLVVSVILRRFLKSGYIRFGSISLSILSGKLMIRDFAFMTNDYTVRCCYAIFVFNYWTRFVPEVKSSSERRCLYVYFYGLETHVYNRTSVYDTLRDLFQIKRDGKHDSSEICMLRLSSKKNPEGLISHTSGSNKHHALVEDDDDDEGTEENVTEDSTQGFLDVFWTHARRLLPCVKFNLELMKLCAGNHLLPRALVLTCSRMVGQYGLADAPSPEDRYQHHITADFVNLLCSLSPVSEYAGQHAIEEPPKAWDGTFHLFHFGRGRLTYMQDEPGLHSGDLNQPLSDDLTVVTHTWPTWAMTIQVTKDCRLHYGPWADRQRNLLWHFFFPPSYQVAQPNNTPIPGRSRMPEKFAFKLITKTDISLGLFFVNAAVTESFCLLGLAESKFELNVPWVIEPDGFVSTLCVSFVQAQLLAQHLWSEVLHADELKLNLRMHYPREWNMTQTWDIDLDVIHAQLVVLFDYKRFFKSLFEDWTRGAHPDLLTFVPCIYKFRVAARSLNFVLIANDYNWVSSTTENAHISFWGKRFLLSFELPFIDFLPATVPIIYKLEGFAIELRLSLPETSTMLYVIRELHSRLKLVDRSGRLQTTTPFHIHSETVPDGQKNGKSVQRYWIDCAWAPRFTLRIGYVYHPSPWVSEYWRFLPTHMRPHIPVAKTGARPSGRIAHGVRQYRRRGRKHGHKIPAVAPLIRTHSDSSSQSELEELALRGLRPEGSQTQGPTEDDLLKSDFDASYFAPDTVDVHLHVAQAQLCFYGTLLRHFAHLKENYFGCYQRPVDFAGPPMSAEEYQNHLDEFSLLPPTDAPNASVKRSKVKRIIDPRECRPILVRLSIEGHNIQAHLPTHSCSANAPCPTAFLDCIGFEMDKRWHETKIQLIFSPVLLCTYDQCKDNRPKTSGALAKGRLQLMGFCLRGQGLFSHLGLPLAAETVEYAWLLELHVGRITGQLTAPQLAGIVHALNGFLFTMTDPENQLICSRDFELCQHAKPQSLCSSPLSLSSDIPCPGETQLKYRLLRFSLDGLDVAVVESGACLSLQLEPVRLSNCNMHGPAQRNGLFAILPGVRLVQFIRPSVCESEDAKAKRFGTPTNAQRVLQLRWIEAGSLSLGPVHITMSHSPEQPELPIWQLAFLRRHDARTKRLWFLWSDFSRRSFPQTKSLQSSPSKHATLTVLPNCGCYGQCSFFGLNESGRQLYYELSSGVFKPRTVFPPRSVYRPDLCTEPKASEPGTGSSVVSEYLLFHSEVTARDNLPESSLQATLFGESLLIPHRLMHELHNPSVCLERLNGLLLMREELIAAAQAAESLNMEHGKGLCCEDSELSDETSVSISGATQSYPTSLSDMSGDFAVRIDETVSLDFGRKHPHCHTTKTQLEERTTDANLIRPRSSRPSSGSELLVPPDSGDEIPAEGNPLMETDLEKRTRRLTSHLPSNLSLNSLMNSLTPSSSSSSFLRDNDNVDKPFPVTDLTKPPVPPTPPPRRFTTHSLDENGAPKPNEPAAGAEPRHPDDKKEISTDPFDKFVDLRSQLHRPITESGLLRSAYARHLSVYECHSGWAEGISLNQRWHVCKHIYSGFGLKNSGSSSLVSLPSPRLGIALAPRFQLVQPGFCPRSITLCADETKRSCGKSTTYKGGRDQHTIAQRVSPSNVTVRLHNSVEILLSPLFTESLERYVKVLTPVLANTPASTVVDSMHSTCVKLRASQIPKQNQSETSKVSTHLLGTPAPSVPDSAAHRTVLTGVSSQSTIDSSMLKSLPAHKYSASSMFPHSGLTASRKSTVDSPVETLSLGDSVLQSSISSSTQPKPVVSTRAQGVGFDSRRKSVPNRSLYDSSGSILMGGKFAALTVEQINICFIQLYAVEDLVHLDSLRSGLQDLTCVSLLALCVDSVSFELLSCRPTESVLPIRADRLDEVSDSEDDSSSSCPSVHSRDPLLDHQSPERNSFFHTGDLPDARITQPSERTSGIRLTSHPSLPGPKSESNDFVPSDSTSVARPVLHIRQPSAPPVLTNNWALHAEQNSNIGQPNGESSWSAYRTPFINCESNKPKTPILLTSPLSDASTILNRDSDASTVKNKSSGLHRATQDTTNPDSPPGNGVEAPKTLDEIPSDQFLDRTGCKLVCELDVRRIHVQLRRLTRCSQFNADVLLTAIPFESSRTFFMFESDSRVASYTPTVATHTVGVNESGLSVWDERSAGWIMFECGLERLSLSCNRRYGFTDSPLDVIELRTPESKTAAQIQADESVHRTLRSTSSCAGTESLPKVRIRKSTNIRSVRPPSVETGTGAKDMPVPSHCTDSQPDRGEKSVPTVPQKPETPFDMHPNGFVTRLLVNTVWLNFATPKRLPNKRRIKLVRSDWNLLSTAAPSIRAWMDPCYRLITACRSLYTHMERRFLAVTACLMTEAVNPKSAISRDKERTTFFHLLGDKELTAYARHRTQKAQTLRFDPSCQLLLVLRRYLIALGVRFGQNEADRRLNEWLHEPDVPPSDLLQCGILSLTREWRFLVELLALSAEDLRGALARPSPLNDRRTPANAPPSLRRSMDVAKAVDPLVGKTSKRHRTLSKVSRTVADAFTHAPTSVPASASVIHSVNFVGDPNSGLTSKLLRMAAGPISPTTNYTTYQTRRSKLLGGSNHTDAIPGTLSTENRTGGSTVEPTIFGPQLDSNWDSGHAQYDVNEVDKNFQNPILRRFLSDAKAPLADVLHANLLKTETTKLVTEASPQRLVTESSLQPPKKTIFPRDDIMQHPALSSDSYRDTSGSTLGAADTKGHEHNQETAKLPEDVRVTTADIEQAAHLSAQFQHVAYIQRFFGPLLESVGISAKGIRRTALMKKFGGFFSADGLLEIFQVEIVSSTRNPMVCRPQTPLNPSGTTASVAGSSAHRRAKIPTPIGRQSAFLCRNFGSRLTLRDVVDHSDKKDMLPNTPGMDRFDLVSTTTKVHVMLSVDFLRQHVNLPLLRLVHQFITMVYCARDTRNALGPQPTGIPAPADLVMPTAQNKPNSKDSSDHTEDTLPSRSFGFVRFGDGSSGSAEQSEDAPGGTRVYSTDFAEYQVPLVPRDRLSGDLTSNSSAGKDSHLAEASSGIPTNPSLPQEEPVTQRAGAEPLIAGNVPSCWQRLFNYVELYTTVPKTRMVIRKPVSSPGGMNNGMATIAEENQNLLVPHETHPAAPLRIKVPSESHQFDYGIPQGANVIKQTTTSFARRLLPAVAYRPLGEDVEMGAGYNPLPTSNVQLLFSAPSDSPNRATAPSSGANLGHSVDHVPSSHQHQTGVSPSTFSQDPSDPIPMQRTPSTVGARLFSEPRMPVGAFEQFTYPWICSERLPLCIFITAKVHQMAVTAVLSELNLSAGVRNVHGSFVHSTQVRGRGSFTERYSSQCLSLHCDDGQLQLTERLPPIVHQVVCVRSGPSRALLSCSRSRQNERNSCLISVGRVTVTLPHHPVRLHGVVQRQAKRISSTMFELLRGSPALRSNSHSLNFAENAPTACRGATTPTTCSTTTTTTSDMTGQIGQSRPQASNAPVRLSTYSSSSSPPLVFSLLAVVQGLTLNVALHPTLTAIYHMDPVYFIGQLGPRGHVDIDLTDHSLSFRSLRPPVNFPQSVCLALPRIVTTVVRRISSGGRYSRGLRKEPIITEGLTAEQGLYLDIQVTVNTLEQTLTTDMLNYIVVVVKLFMREINEVIQKMAGEEQSAKGTTRLRPSYSSLVTAMNAAPKPHDTNGFLSRAARGKTKFTIRIRMKEIQLMATTPSGAVKLEAQKIDVELTNRVSQASINSNILSFPKSSTSENSGTRGPPRPSNLNLCSTSVLHWSPLSEQPYSSLEGGGDSLFIYASVGYICAELGYLDQDVLYKERSPEFKTVALFKTSIALRSLLADEKFASSSSNTGPPQTECRYVPGGSCEHDAFLISLNRPTLWIKPFTFDRAILMWMVYKRELAKWNEHMKYLISMAAPVVEPSSRRSPVHKTTLSSSREYQPGVLEPVTSTPPPCTAPPTTTNINSDTETSPQAQGGNALNRETHGDSSNASTLFLQLNVEELGVCFPINIFQSGVQSMEADSRTALVLTLDRSRISACYRESLVSQSEFTDFCLRFDDEFNVGSDDWRPDWKRATVDVKGKPHLVILNACVVPSGTFSVCWRDLENRAQWHLIIRWQMRGLDFHLDDNIGRRIKALIGIVTRITGYRGAAPLLATSAEEEDEEFVNQSPVQEEKTDCATRSKTEVPVHSKQPLSVNSGGSRHRPRRPMTRDLLGRVSDNASLDGYIPIKSIQISPNALPLADALRHRRPFNLRTLIRIGQKACLACKLETLVIDVCCVHEARIRNSSPVVRLTSPSSPSVKFHLQLSENPEAVAAGLASVGVALSGRAEAALIDGISVDNCKDIPYQTLHDLLRRAKRGDIVILAGEMNARVGRLSSNEAHFGGPTDPDFCRSEMGNSCCPDLPEELARRTKTLPEEMLPDLAQVRSMELLKHKQELLEAQYCQAFKRQKWNTLRRRGPTLSRSPLLQTRLTGSSSVQRIAPLRSTSDRGEKVTVPLSPDWSQSTSFRSTLLESNADGSEPANLAFHAADPARPLSLLSGDESIYFDVDARDRDSLATRGGQTFDLSSSFESMTGEPNETNTNEEPKMDRRSDLWFDPLENPEANQIDADLLSAFPDDGFPADGPPDASSDSDDMDLTIRPETRSSHVTNDSASAYGSHAEKLSQPPPPPPRRACLNERKHSPPLVQPGRNKEPDLTPQVHLRVDVQIHVDSGCCVLHPRLPNKVLNTDTDPRHGMDTWGAAIPPTMPNRTGSSVVDNTVLTSPRGNLMPGCSSRPQLECGLRSMGELLPGYLERYKRYLLQDPQFFATDLSIFYLPAVDIGLHYSSMTEVDLNSSSVEPFGIQPRSDETVLPDLAGGTKSPGPRTADLRGCSAELTPDPDQSRINVTSSSQNAPVSSSLKKEAELYMSCFLQKLPQELVIHPALLDFLEQALEDIPLVSDVGPDAKSLSSEEGGSTGGAKKDSNESIDGHASSPSLDGLLLETFPVHTVVHLHIQPSAVRLLCLPTSRMQCFMVLPFMDAVFSTKRNSEESRRDSANNPTNNPPGNRQSTVLSDPSELRSDISVRGTTVRLTPASAAGDIISEGGLCVTAILKEFRISVFHPFGDVKSNRSDTNWGPAWSGDSLTLLIRDIQFSLSRTIQLSLIQLGPGNARGPEAGSFCTAVSSSERADSARLRYLTPIGATALTGSGSDTWGLHRAVRFSGVFDIGAAIFTCDTRRTLEILDIPKAWYRSSLARRLFLGNEDVIDGFQASELKRMATADDGLFQSPASPTADDNSTVEQESSQEHAFGAEVPLLDTENQTQPVLSGKFRRLTCPASFPRDTEETTKPEYCKTLGNSSDVPRPATNLVSHSITLAGERPSGRNTSPNGSLKVTSWNALPIFCVHLKRFDLNLYMGSAMGLTRMTIDNLFCDGRASIHSSGRKNTMLSTGLGTCQFTSEGGGVGGEFCLMDCDALIRLDDDPLRDPEHNLDCRIGGFQLRVEYMSTNILLVRLSSLSLHLQDEWRLRDVARQQLLLLSSSISNRPSSIGANIPSQRHPVTVGSRVPTTGFEESSGDMLQSMEEDIGVPPVYVRVVGEVNWDQAQTAIVRTTTPDLMRAVLKVREYFEEQVREGRMSLIGQTGSFGLFSSTTRDPHMTTSQWPGWYQSASYQDDSSNRKTELTETEIQIVDQLLQRHWQGLYGAVKAYAREHLGMIMGVTTDEPEPETSTSTADEKCPVLGGSFQLSGRSLGIACFAGSFRSAPDWAVFNIQYPTACFETEAQHEAPVCRTADTVIDPSELEGWVNVRQVLSFDLGSHPHFQPQMAYVLRVRRGRQPTAKTPPTLSITEWLEFAFRGADNTVLNFVRTHDTVHIPMVVQLSQFPVNFPSTLPATSSHPFVDVLSGPALSQARGFSDPSELGSSDSAVTAAHVIDPRAVHPWRYRLCGASIRKPNSFPAAPTTTSGAGSVPAGSTLTVAATTTSPSDVMVTDNNAGISSSSAHAIGSSTTDSVPVQPVPPVRSNPLKPPSDAEILFVLPSISLRITSDQRQTMAQPSLSTLPFIQIPVTATGADDTQAASKSESLASDTLTGDPAASGHTVKSSRLWFYGPRNTSATKETDSAKETNVSSTASRGFDYRQPFSPSVKISFQTDFHGFVQLGLIDVPWLPTLISSYLNERLQEYELTSVNANEARGAFGVSNRYSAAGSELTARLRQIAATSSPLVHDARSYEIVHWSLSPECRWLLATSIGVPAFDRLLESVGFRKARITIPKWLQRGVMDHLDHVTSILLRASLRLITDESPKGDAQTGDSKVVQSGPRITVDISNKRTSPPSVKTHVAEKPANSKSSFPRPSFNLSVDED